MKKYILSVFLFLFLSGNINTAFATHAAGMELTYQCLGNNQYLFYATFYRDCHGISAPEFLPIDISSVSCSYSETFFANLLFSTQGSDTISHLAGLCAGFNSQCVGGTYTGYEQYIYSVTVTLPFSCNDWIVATHESSRNDAITNLADPGSYDLYVECHLDNTNNLCNNSPVFSGIPIAYSCVDQPFVYNHGAFDPDGDLLVYTLVNPLDTLNYPIPYSNVSFSPTYPLVTSTGTFDFNSQTGQMSCIPAAVQIAVISVRIDEYRNGMKIGSTQSDLEVLVNACTNNVPEIPLGMENVTGATLLDPNTLLSYPGSALDFDLVGLDSDAGNILTMTTNLQTIIPDASLTTSGSNPITGHFTWNTSVTDSGQYVFTVTITDDGCPFTGQQVYSYTILSDTIATGNETAPPNTAALRLYPNPASNIVHIVYQAKEEGVLELADAAGVKFKSLELFPSIQDQFLWVNDLADGIYFYTVRTKEGLTQSGKIVLVR